MSNVVLGGEIRPHDERIVSTQLEHVEVHDGSTVAEVVVTYCGTVVAAEHVGHRGLEGFTIGESHAATFAVPPDGLPERAAFPLVRRGDHGYTLAFGHDMAGDVRVDGTMISLAELVRTGRADRAGDVCTYALPVGARCRVHHGDLTFHVRSVPPGARVAGRRDPDRPFWAYNAASLVAIGAVVSMLHLLPEDAASLDLEEQLANNRFVGYLAQPDHVEPEESPPTPTATKEPGGGSGQRHAGNEGRMGDPTKKQAQGVYAMKGPKDAMKQLARNFDLEMDARNQGILGVMKLDSGHFLASPYGEAFAIGNDDEDVWGGFHGTEIGAAFGNGGMGLIGSGRGGGGNAVGMVGLGHVGRIGKGGGGGPGLGYGRDGGAGFGARGPRKPKIHIGVIKPTPGVDKDIIRRVVRAHINEVRHCYNQGLARRPNLRGRVAVQFTIGPRGTVPLSVVAESSVKDANVGRCIAKAVKRWRFPKPRFGGNAIVTYPFVLNPG